MYKANPLTLATTGRLRTDQRPLYVQASEALENLVQNGHYAAGDRLPSEIELSQQLGISRPTLREALRLLEEEGVIIRRHGVGTFVAAPQPIIESGLEVLESIERLAERRGLSTGMVELMIEERPATPHELHELELNAATPVTAVKRVVLTDGQRIAYLTDVVPQKYLRRIDLQNPTRPTQSTFRGSVLNLFLERGRPELSHSRTELVAVAADAKLARYLRIQPGAPLLKLEARLYAQNNQVVDYSRSYFVPDRFRFHVVRRIG